MEEASALWMANKKKKNNQNKLGVKQQQQLKRQHDHKRQHNSLMHRALGKQNKTNEHVSRKPSTLRKAIEKPCNLRKDNIRTEQPSEEQ